MRLPFKKAHSIFLLSFLIIKASTGEDKRLTTYANARSLVADAQTLNWPRFNGPFDNATTSEKPLVTEKGKLEIDKIWELTKGQGYASPSITKDRLILFHLHDGKEIIEARNPVNGKAIWSHQYPVEYRDRYGYSNGPRASPVIWQDKVYAHGVTAWLTCLDIRNGNLLWKRDLKSEFEIPDYFFGKGSNPIINNDSLILNVGGKNNECVIAFDLLSGKTKWITQDIWGASYSSPVNAKIHGKNVCLVLTGGESRPPHGGLLVLDAETGNKLTRFAWRSSSYESANAVPPIPISNNRIFLSECYEKGGVMISLDSKFRAKIDWHEPKFNIHWMTPIIKGDYLYGIAGRHQRGAEVFCASIGSGKTMWRNRVSWQTKFADREFNLELFRGALLGMNKNYIGLSELGSLILLEMNPEGFKILDTKQLFFAPGTWTLPALSHGLLYVMQNEKDRASNKEPRIICYDLRAD